MGAMAGQPPTRPRSDPAQAPIVASRATVNIRKRGAKCDPHADHGVGRAGWPERVTPGLPLGSRLPQVVPSHWHWP